MATVEMVDKLRGRANVTYEDAREALDSSGDDILEALIWLEKNGKVAPPRAGYYSTDAGAGYDADYSGYESDGSARYYDSKRMRSDRKDRKDREAQRGKEGRSERRFERRASRYGGSYRDSGSRARNGSYYKEGHRRGFFTALLSSAAKFLIKAFHIGNTTSFEISRYGREIIKFPLTILVVALILFFHIVVIMLPVGLFFGFRYRLSGSQFDETTVNSVMDSAAHAADGIKDAINKNGQEK